MKNYRVLQYKNFANCDYVQNAPCYRTIISLAFLHYSFYAGSDSQIEDEITLFKDAVTGNTPQPYTLGYPVGDEEQLCMEVYPVDMGEDELGYLYVDHTNSCYPLVLYPREHKVKNSPRSYAFVHAVNELESKKELLIKLFKKYQYIPHDKDIDDEKVFMEFHKELHKFVHEDP